MKTPSFFNGVLLAFILSFFAAAVFAAFTLVWVPGLAIRVVIAALGLAYILYLFRHSPARVGRVTTVVLWSLGALAAWIFSPSLAIYLLIHAGMIWLIRALYFATGVVPALLDLGLSGLALAAGVWAAGQTGSVFLAVWSFFLVQALFVVIPRSLRSETARSDTGRAEDPFERAHRNAEAALRRLTANI